MFFSLSVTKFEHDSYIDENGVPVLKVYNIKGAVMMALTVYNLYSNDFNFLLMKFFSLK